MDKRKVKKILVVSIALFLIGAMLLILDSRGLSNHDIGGNYSVTVTDASSGRRVSYDLGGGSYIERIPGEITALGWNDDFIIAKQRDQSEGERFFILVKGRDHKYAEPSESVIGPLSETQFHEERIRNGVPEKLKFTTYF